MSATTQSPASGSVEHDASGDVTYDGRNSYLYNAEGQICAVSNTYNSITTMIGYVYDADGQRLAKGTITTFSCDVTTNGFQTQSDYVRDQAGNQLSEFTPGSGGSMVLAHTNVWANGVLIATDDVNKTHFYLNDWLGTRRVQTDYAGNLEQSCASLPYGDGETCGPAPTENLYTGKERDAESGNDYFGARYYASTMGRFLSPDWSAKVEPVPYAKLGDPQSLNLYDYMLDNPLGGVDADGHNAKCKGTICTTGIKKLQAKQAQQQSVKTKTLKFLAKHKTAVKVVSRAIIVGTVVSGAVDGGASEAAVPEEAAGEAALETAIDAETEGAAGEAGEAGEASEGAGAKASDNLKSIEKAQQRVRSGSDGGKRIIDSIQKSVDRVGHMLNRITQGDYDPEDWE
ncbi:MAG TPA: RHS repeat-associated core domain-containing protein [Acidobacteriaceae bacterium]|nr:RHS repeat-associated core domain-containing protein [Acidobacteriaceae bacterium]